MQPKSPIQACIFDLDGVIVDTAKFHFIAWRRLANELGFDFTEAENEELKGVGRMESLDLILQWGGIAMGEAERQEWADRKNGWYLELVGQMQPGDILEGALPFLEDSRNAGKRLAVGSASKNARTILDRIGLGTFFDAVVDGHQTNRTKPDPQVFLFCAEALGVAPQHAIVFEDAAKGVEAGLNGGFFTVGIGQQEVLQQAHLVVPNFIGWTIQEIENKLIQG